MIQHSRRWVLLAVAIVAVVFAAAFGIASVVGSSDGSPRLIPESGPIAHLLVVTPTASERKIAKGLRMTEASLASAREVFESPEAGRMVFFPKSHGGCLIMFGGTSCGDPNDPTLPVLSLMTSVESSPYLVGGGITRFDVAEVIFKDSAGHEVTLPAAGGVFMVRTRDRLTRDSRYVRTESKTCDKRVIADARDNGRVDRIYPLRCYRQAIALLPHDSPARGEIQRALSAAHSAPPPPGKTN